MWYLLLDGCWLVGCLVVVAQNTINIFLVKSLLQLLYCMSLRLNTVVAFITVSSLLFYLCPITLLNCCFYLAELGFYVYFFVFFLVLMFFCSFGLTASGFLYVRFIMVFGTVIFITAPFFLLFSILFVNALPIGLVKEGFGGIFNLLSFFSVLNF